MTKQQHDILVNEAKQKVKIIDFVQGNKYKKGDAILVNPCPSCGKKDHFFIYPNTNSYSSFASCCSGGSVIDWFVEIKGYSRSEATNEVIKISGLDVENYKDIYINPKEVEKQEQEQEFIEELNQWGIDNLKIYSRIWRRCDQLLKEYKNPEQQDEFFYYILELREQFEIYTDILVNNDLVNVHKLRHKMKKRGIDGLETG